MRILVNDFSGHAFQVELSRELARRGHTVLHVYFAGNNTPKGQLQIQAGDPPAFSIHGLNIGRAFEKHSILKRKQADVDYGRLAAAKIAEFGPDVVLSSNMPPHAQSIFAAAAHRNHARFVFWLQDVYYIAARFVFEKRFRPMAWAVGWYFKRLEKKLMQQSDAIVCIVPEFATILRSWGIYDSKITVIENWAPLGEIVPAPRDNAWAREQGAEHKFCFIYSGTLGMKHRPELLLALAKRLEERGDARLIVIAAGVGAEWLRERSHEVSPEHLKMLPFQPYERISEVFGAADVLITLLDSDAGTFAVPSKTLSYLCAGRAVIVAAPTENKAVRVVEDAQAGLIVSPDDPAGIVSAAERFLEDPALVAECASNARRYAEQHFAIHAIADRFLAVLREPAEVSQFEPALRLASGDAERN